MEEHELWNRVREAEIKGEKSFILDGVEVRLVDRRFAWFDVYD